MRNNGPLKMPIPYHLGISETLIDMVGFGLF